MVNIIADSSPSNWEDITCILADIRTSARMPPPRAKDELLHMIAAGTAFLTFDYGIDGVSIEIAKYALALEYLYSSQTECAIHFIGGDFYPQADSVLKPNWRRHKIAGINGWSKWDGGKWRFETNLRVRQITLSTARHMKSRGPPGISSPRNRQYIAGGTRSNFFINLRNLKLFTSFKMMFIRAFLIKKKNFWAGSFLHFFLSIFILFNTPFL